VGFTPPSTKAVIVTGSLRLLDDFETLRRHRVDAALGHVPAMVPSVADVVQADEQRDEEQAVDGRAGAISRGALADEAAQVLHAEREVRDDQERADAEMQPDDGVVEAEVGIEPEAEDQARDEAEAEQDQAEEAQEGRVATHRLPPAHRLDRAQREKRLTTSTVAK
jgi:hypothetical protein